MKTCTYDNPATMARECWQSGKFICHYQAVILPPFAKKSMPTEVYFFGANIGKWQTGRIVGDKSAMRHDA